MTLIVTDKRSFLKEQGVVLGLVVLMTVIYTCQHWIPFGWDQPFKAVPADVAESWRHLMSGKLALQDLKAFGTTLSCAFLHGDSSHLMGNMLYFWGFGALLNELLGWRWLLGILLFTAIGASSTHIIMNHERAIPMLGASGVVYGFMGAYLGLAVRWRLPDPHVWPLARPVAPSRLVILALVYVLLDYHSIFSEAMSNIAYGAHVGGFTMGLFLTSFITPRPIQALSR